MILRTKLFGHNYEFKSICEVMAKANEQKSGDALAGIAVGEEEERMDGFLPVDQWLVLGLRDDGADAVGEEGLGADEVDDGEELVGLDDVRHEWAEHVGEGGEDADDFVSLLGFEFADAVVCLHDGFGFDVDRLAGGRLVVYDAADTSLESGGYGDD